MRSSFRLQLVGLSILTSAFVTFFMLNLVWAALGAGRLSDRFDLTAFSNNGSRLSSALGLTTELSVEEIVGQVSPAVVSITSVYEQSTDSQVATDEELAWWLNWFNEGLSREAVQVVSGGSGFIINSDGKILTNKHVVEGAQKLVVTLNDGETYPAEVIMTHDKLDLAVISIDTDKDLPVIKLSQEKVRVGQSVVAIGNALSEFANSVSVGVVSGLERSIVAMDNFGQEEELEHLIQTDAAINPGNSGGPLLNRQGEVVGVNVAMAEGYENISFALPITLLYSSVEPFLAD